MTRRPAARLARVAALALLALGVRPAPLAAQVAPHGRWTTLRTPHFRVHFARGLEEQARRAAANAEWAYGRLATELRPPRGPIDLVVADNVDYTNGFATPFPSNRIVVYAHPPVDVQSLRFYDDWNRLLVAHELTHVFHLDRAGGWWGAAQRIFGRNPVLFPNAYAPAWLTEGLAVYYESRLTGAGRVLGSEHSMIARASALAGGLPRLDELSLATPHFPGGQAAYAYGSLLLDHLAATRGADGVPRLVETLSRQAIPFRVDRAARRAFGASFSRAWREWRDSATRALPAAGEPLPRWRELSTAGWYALYPRWRDSAAIVYAANTGKETAGAYEVGLDGRARRLGRRNSLEPNEPLADGGLLFAQLEFTDAYHVRSDLFVQRRGRECRLTKGARLSHPDARADGAIVAVQAVPATTRLVRVSADGRSVAPLTSSAPDTQWSEPRWSPAGDRVAAVRSTRGPHSEVVVLDTLGRVLQVVAGGRAVHAAPSWSAPGASLFFTSDRDGTTNVYHALLADPRVPEWAAGARRVSAAATGLFHPEPSPDGRWLAASLYRADGYHVGVAPTDPLVIAAGEAAGATGMSTQSAAAASAARFDGPARAYAPWHSLVPRYWLPVAQATEAGPTLLGALTSGEDVIGRHAYSAQAAAGEGFRSYEVAAAYRYRGLGQPLLDLVLLRAANPPVRVVGERADTTHVRVTESVATAALTLTRPRFRTNTWAQLGGEIEHHRRAGEPDALLEPLGIRRHRDRRTIFGSIGWSNVQRPPLSVSPEDGATLSATAWRRWTLGSGLAPSHEVRAVGTAYKALDLGAFAHHVVAWRAAAGWRDERSTSAFAAGGMSGSSVPVLGAFTVGGERRTFGVRGFPAESRLGIRAAAGSLELRAPLSRPGRGLGVLPLFFDRTSFALFGDAAAAWCPPRFRTAAACLGADLEPRWIASAGAELNLDAGVLAFDYTYRFRAGLAAPVAKDERDAVRAVSGYVTLGISF